MEPYVHIRHHEALKWFYPGNQFSLVHIITPNIVRNVLKLFLCLHLYLVPLKFHNQNFALISCFYCPFWSHSIGNFSTKINEEYSHIDRLCFSFVHSLRQFMIRMSLRFRCFGLAVSFDFSFKPNFSFVQKQIQPEIVVCFDFLKVYE
jgi:hypothetical protein